MGVSIAAARALQEQPVSCGRRKTRGPESRPETRRDFLACALPRRPRSGARSRTTARTAGDTSRSRFLCARPGRRTRLGLAASAARTRGAWRVAREGAVAHDQAACPYTRYMTHARVHTCIEESLRLFFLNGQRTTTHARYGPGYSVQDARAQSAAGTMSSVLKLKQACTIAIVFWGQGGRGAGEGSRRRSGLLLLASSCRGGEGTGCSAVLLTAAMA